MPEGDFLATLRQLRENDVDFILIGGLAAVLNGAPIQTFDIDLVYSQEPSNIDRLLAVLTSLDAVFRIQPERRLRPDKSHLAGGGHLNLQTSHGPLDLLGSVGDVQDYDDLLPQSAEMEVGQGIRVHVLNLETIISIKERLGSEKDIAMLPVLRRTLIELRNKP